MAIAFVQARSVQSSSASTITTPSMTSAAGHVLTAAVVDTVRVIAGSPVTDSRANTWTNAWVDHATSSYAGLYSATDISGGASHTVTFTPPGGSDHCALGVAEFSGLAATTALDQVASTHSGISFGGGPRYSGSTAPTARAHTLLIGVGSSTTGTTVPFSVGLFTDFVALADGIPEGILASYAIVTAIGAYTYAWVHGDAANEAAGIATFKGSGIAFVQGTSVQSSSASSITTPAITATAGHFLSAGTACYSRSLSGSPVTDNHSSTWANAWVQNGGSNGHAGQYYAENIPGGSGQTVTFTPPGGADFCALAVGEFSGIATSSSLDTTASAASAAEPHTSGATAATTQATELLLGLGSVSHGIVVPASLTVGAWTDVVALADSAPDGLVLAYQIVAAIGTYEYGFVNLTGFSESVGIAAFSAVPPPAPLPTIPNATLVIGITWLILTTRTGTQYVWSDRALPDPSSYYRGWKEPRVLAWGKISRALSNVLTGQYENAVFTVDLDDTDRLLRGLDDDRDLIGATVVVQMISDVGRRALEVPTTVFRGVVTDAQPTATLRYALTMKDPFAEHLVAHTPPPLRVFNTADFPNCALDKVPCSAAAYLVNGAILIGVTVVVVDTGYGIFAPGAVFTFAGHVTVYTVSSSTLTDPETSVTFSPALTANVANNEVITVQASFTVPTAVGQRVQVPYGLISDYHLTSGVDDGDGQGPMVYVGDRVLADGKTYGEFIWSAAACYSPGSPATPFQMLYFFNNPLDGAGTVNYGATAVTFGSLATEAGSGGRIAVPGSGNWATLGYTTTYVDLNSRRYTRLFLRGIFRDWALGILKAPDNLGGVPFSVNAYGCETVGDATGTLITNGLLQYLHVLQNWLPPIGDCYQTGAWLTTPLYPDGTPMIDEAAFAAADAQSAIYVPDGFRGDFILGAHNDQVSGRDLIARLNLSFGVQNGFDNTIAFTVKLVNTDLGSLALAYPLGYERDIFAGSFTITGVTRDLYTAITYRHTQEYLGRAPDGWRSVVSGVTEVENTGATSDYGGKTTYQTLFLYMVRGKNRSIDADDYARGTETATAVLALTLARVSAIQHLPVLGTGPAGFSYELGDVVPVTHYEGLSTAGWIARPIRIERVEIDPSQFISGLEGYDLDPML